ncbi:class I SAM-dependent methyltransferase [Streptomyces achromogenes]|uniref:class I SAM-dependent methyltransferase n=1 Tax=Streptomyces achromogenes TaxID=67255 RepID=UPI0036F8352B
MGGALPGRGDGTRRLDLRYSQRPAASHHRPYFPFVEKHAFRGGSGDGLTLLDIGCANGAFLDYLASRRPTARCSGLDALPELVAYARRQVPAASFSVGDITDGASLPTGKFSVVTMLTLHSHFDSLDPWLENLLGLIADGGRAVLFGPFNPQPVDVLVRLRAAEGEPSEWTCGWNVHSRHSFAARLRATGRRFAFHDYVPPDDRHARAESGSGDVSDPLATRPAVLDGRPVLMNGSGLTLPFALLEIFP